MTASQQQILALNRFDAHSRVDGPLSERIRKRQAAFGASSILFYREPIQLIRGEGVHLFDQNGYRYLDLYNNVPSVGHCHPKVVEAISRQAGTLNINTRYLNDVVERYADRLLATFPRALSNVVLTCTGSESNDLAMRIAQSATGNRGFIVTRAAYHGNTAAVTDISPSSFRRPINPPHVRIIAAPETHEDVAARFARDVEKAAKDLNEAGFGVAALIVDTIFSSDGIFADPPGFLRAACAAVRQAGGLFIADEVQPGFGRTGHGLWGFDRHGIVPDIVTMGKPMGNGFPMGGVVTRPELLSAFCDETGYFNTFGGNPVAAAVGLAVLDVIEDEGLIENAAKVGGYLRELLGHARVECPSIAEVRGSGLFVGIELRNGDGEPNPKLASRLINQLKEEGILIGAAGLYGNTLKVRSPLCLKRDDADVFVSKLHKLLSSN